MSTKQSRPQPQATIYLNSFGYQLTCQCREYIRSQCQFQNLHSRLVTIGLRCPWSLPQAMAVITQPPCPGIASQLIWVRRDNGIYRA